MDIDLGYMTDKAADTISKALNGKSYMKFRVDVGTVAAGSYVTLHAEERNGFKAHTPEEVLSFALFIMADEVSRRTIPSAN
jgi:hypothetical protein